MSKFSRLTAAVCFTLSLGSTAVLAHENHGKPQFGGVVAEALEAQFEVVGKGGQVIVYASTHGTPLATVGASGKLTVLDGVQKSEITLKPAGDNRLSGTGNLAAGAKLMLQVQWPDKKPLQARTVMP